MITPAQAMILISMDRAEVVKMADRSGMAVDLSKESFDDTTALVAAGMINPCGQGTWCLADKGRSWGNALAWICMSSAEDALRQISGAVDTQMLSAGLLLESKVKNRATVLHALDARIRKLQKLRRKA